MGSSCPSQNIQPAGAKLPPKIRISPTYGWAMSSVLAREYALEGDAEGEHQEGLHVVVRLTAADVRERARHEGCDGRGRRVLVGARRQQVAAGRVHRGVVGCPAGDVEVLRHL